MRLEMWALILFMLVLVICWGLAIVVVWLDGDQAKERQRGMAEGRERPSQ